MVAEWGVETKSGGSKSMGGAIGADVLLSDGGSAYFVGAQGYVLVCYEFVGRRYLCRWAIECFAKISNGRQKFGGAKIECGQGE